MPSTKFEELKSKFPDLLDKIWGFSCEDGWFSIIETALAVIKNHCERKKIDCHFVQIKEKFGGLRMYSEGGDDFIDGVVTLAESLSYQTCEVTGNPGYLCTTGRWLKTLCPEQAEILGYKKYEKKI